MIRPVDRGALTMESKAKGQPLAVVLAILGLVLPLAYGTSIGPAIWLQGRGYIHPDLTRRLFGPLIWLCECVGPLNDLANWYIDLWR